MTAYVHHLTRLVLLARLVTGSVLFAADSTKEERTAPGVAQATGLRCEYQVNPLGVDAPKPRLRWIIEAKGLG